MIFQTTKKRRKKSSVFITWHLCAENYTPATRHTHTQTHTKKNISKIDGEEIKLESTHTNKMTSKFEVGLRSFIILFSLPFFPCSLSCGLFLAAPNPPPPRTSILPKTVIFKWLLVHTCRTSAIETISSDWIEHLKTIEIADVHGLSFFLLFRSFLLSMQRSLIWRKNIVDHFKRLAGKKYSFERKNRRERERWLQS